ncbi:MAG: hypothetical protein FWE27_08610 [Defluviitaleaceae bacterium]|nr:hypothetical protein [Defluviitaleaceae bacterium]
MKSLQSKTKMILAIVAFIMVACILLLIYFASRPASNPSDYIFNRGLPTVCPFSSEEFSVIFSSEPEPIPRNVRILIDTTHAVHSATRHTLLELNGSTLVVTRLGQATPDVIYSGERLSLSEGWDYIECWDTSLCYEGIEYFDVSLLDDFAESRNFPCLSGLVGHQSILIKPSEDIASVELSQEQLEDVWRRIDAVVRRYEQPRVQNGIGHTNVMAVIGGEFYFSQFSSSRGAYSRPELTRRSRREWEQSPLFPFFDTYLERLAHELIDLSPIRTGWEPQDMTEQ